MTSAQLLRLHRWVGLGLGVVVAVLALAGASLVFRDELTVMLTPEVAIPPRGQPVRLQGVLDAARRLAPGAQSLEIIPATRPDRATEVIIRVGRQDRQLFVDPHDGRVVADSERQWMPFATLFRLHKQLLAGEAGGYAAGAAGLALAFMAASGLILWWPRAWKRAFRLRLGGNRVAVSYDLHRCAGAVFALFLLVNAVTGLSMVFDEAAPRLVNALSRSAGVTVPSIPAPAPGAARPLDEIVAAANRAFPAGSLSRIHVTERAPVVVRKRIAGQNETRGMNRIYVDPSTASVLKVSTLEGLPPGNAMYEWLYPLHTGRLIGLPYRALLALVGLVPVLSLVTGFILWRSRARTRTPASAAAPVRSALPSKTA